jgi:hypothetical protein
LKKILPEKLKLGRGRLADVTISRASNVFQYLEACRDLRTKNRTHRLLQVWVNWTEVAEVIIKFSGTSNEPSSANWPGDSLESENVIAFLGMFRPLPMLYGCHVTLKALSVLLVCNQVECCLGISNT